MACLEMVGLGDCALKRVDRLSGGQSQRVAIARALMQRPRLVFADEPVASRDPRAGAEVMALFARLMNEQKIAVLFTSHQVRHALDHGDRIIALRNGKIALDAPTAEQDPHELSRIYGRPSDAGSCHARALRATGALRLILSLLVVLAVVSSLEGAELSLSKFVAGVPRFVDMVARMLPPDVSRLEIIGARLLETSQMALAGTVIGVVLSLPLAILSTWRHTPHPLVYHAARALVALFRTVPDLVWALLFVIAVGLGPSAGTLALVADTIGFCRRFFAEAMEEVEEGPQEALTALGATRLGVVALAVIPAALPSMINSSLFALERAVRSSVVLGLVGAGGIGIELKVAFDMFQYDLAATIILAIFALVLAVERLSVLARRRII